MQVEEAAGEAVLAAGCKVNLFLRITGRREDGYHTLESLFWPLASPCDTLTVTRRSGTGLRFSCDDQALETSGNIVIKAYGAFARETGFSPGLDVFLQKNIPYGAGLGGGSPDAAALLLHLNTMARAEGKSLAIAELGMLGARLGADVPFFLHNTPSMVRGIGEIIEPLPFSGDGAPFLAGSNIPAGTDHRLAGLHLVLVCPRVHVATAWAFGAWDEKYPSGSLTNGEGEDSSPLVRGVRVHNDLCEVVFQRHPALRQHLALLETFNPLAASMSGSGASLFGLFDIKEQAGNAVRRFRESGERVFHHTL